MERSKLVAVTALAALSLVACDNRGALGGGGSKLCTPFAAANASAVAPAGAPTDGAAATNDCLHRWGYALAASSDPADQVAQATVAACSGQLSRWNQQTMTQAASGNAPAEAPSLLTGEPTTPIAEHLTYAQGRALFYVVQGRAGKCAPPPMTGGAPDGTAAR